MNCLLYMAILQIWLANWTYARALPLSQDYLDIDSFSPGTIEEKEWNTVWRQKRFVGSGMDLVHGLLTAINLGPASLGHQQFQHPGAYHARPFYGGFGGKGSPYPYYGRFAPPLYAGYYGLSGFGFH